MRILSFLIVFFYLGCKDITKLETVSVKDFSKFVKETGYVTDAEKFGWSIFQKDVYTFKVDSGLVWNIPNGVDSAKMNYPVTQVSYNDALAYCEWAKVRLPSYEEFWKLVKSDKRPINESAPLILPNEQTNIVGNVWDITTTENVKHEIRLAGGSYLCNVKTCNGTNPSRELYVDKMTGNTHIGFSVIKN